MRTRVFRQYDAPGDTIELGVEDRYRDADIRLSAVIAERLLSDYPGHFWAVRVDCRQGIAAIQIPILMGPTAHFILKLSNLASDPSLKAVTRAGGEILERYKIPRTNLEKGLPQFLAARAKHRIIRPNDPFVE